MFQAFYSTHDFRTTGSDQQFAVVTNFFEGRDFFRTIKTTPRILVMEDGGIIPVDNVVLLKIITNIAQGEKHDRER